MNWLNGISLRSVLFGVGAIGAIAEAIDIAQRAGVQITAAHWIVLACTALATYAAKWPGDVTSKDANEREERARRASMYPPPLDMTAQKFSDLVRDIHNGKVALRDEENEP